MIESQIFRQSGVGSRAWYIKRIKIGYPAGKTGFTYLRADSAEDGKQLSFDEIKSSMSQLVAAGYVKKYGKPDAPRSDKYEVTSFGHRYLEEHKDELEAKPEPVSTGAAKTGVMHTVPAAPRFNPPIPSDRKPIIPGVQEGVLAGVADRPVSPSPDTNKEQGSEKPRINKLAESGLKTDDQPKNSPPAKTPDSFIDQLKTIAGDLALEKFADQITVKDLLGHAEKWA